MKYPMKEVNDIFCGTMYIEMSPAEYDERIQWYKDAIKRYEDWGTRRDREYADYLKQWFSANLCDGLPNFKVRHELHKLPMSFNVYFG